MSEMAPWRSLLADAIASNEHLQHSTFCQLATVRSNGTPANRTMVFRGFVDGTNNLLFTTDSRSSKVRDVQHCFIGEICYYFTESWEQFRFHGDLNIIDMNSDEDEQVIRNKAWLGSSLKSRAQFVGPEPGQTQKENEMEEVVDASQGPVDAFCALTLHPSEVDYLHLKQKRRMKFRKCDDNDQVWVHETINP